MIEGADKVVAVFAEGNAKGVDKGVDEGVDHGVVEGVAKVVAKGVAKVVAKGVIFMSKFRIEAGPQIKFDLVIERKEGHIFSYHVLKRPKA